MDHNKNEIRYVVSVGKFYNENDALERRRMAMDRGLVCEIIDTSASTFVSPASQMIYIFKEIKSVFEHLRAALEGLVAYIKESINYIIERLDDISFTYFSCGHF